ncbi:hypothetical protein MPTK1_8g08520 [Marchantia polymorpha subsp. ruderalis]|uniref:Uncharacterized protein n=1 Tax=Marchantia polymorpha TaxID=3197 RepID=A0A2R6WRN7_MARPO|nr:hypothetical protein MARPO_0063s0066 [Marchantia polymorpha]BBN19184.1 hypothetical protein Mp_8g08520 [Marchantia polymorpha subsp. ruderalis]|eukprot:PTQ36528.1 hypothetical protein MARPO_0063s0066 [Marchantia polymorpha]
MGLGGMFRQRARAGNLFILSDGVKLLVGSAYCVSRSGPSSNLPFALQEPRIKNRAPGLLPQMSSSSFACVLHTVGKVISSKCSGALGNISWLSVDSSGVGIGCCFLVAEKFFFG